MDNRQFRTAEELAAWLESLHETTPEGAITNAPWEPAQRAARAVREAVPDGMVLVPREPTEAMIEAGDEFYPWTRGTESRRAMPAPETIYAAMIAAAPTQDQENGS